MERKESLLYWLELAGYQEHADERQELSHGHRISYAGDEWLLAADGFRIHMALVTVNEESIYPARFPFWYSQPFDEEHERLQGFIGKTLDTLLGASDAWCAMTYDVEALRKAIQKEKHVYLAFDSARSVIDVLENSEDRALLCAMEMGARSENIDACVREGVPVPARLVDVRYLLDALGGVAIARVTLKFTLGNPHTPLVFEGAGRRAIVMPLQYRD